MVLLILFDTQKAKIGQNDSNLSSKPIQAALTKSIANFVYIQRSYLKTQ